MDVVGVIVSAGVMVVVGVGCSFLGAGVTTTMNVSVFDGLPALSVARHSTRVGPNGNVEPDGTEQTGVIAPSRLSFAVAVYSTTAP